MCPTYVHMYKPYIRVLSNIIIIYSNTIRSKLNENPSGSKSIGKRKIQSWFHFDSTKFKNISSLYSVHNFCVFEGLLMIIEAVTSKALCLRSLINDLWRCHLLCWKHYSDRVCSCPRVWCLGIMGAQLRTPLGTFTTLWY